jgi:hypothetical protein
MFPHDDDKEQEPPLDDAAVDTAHPAEQAPDGGVRAWTQVLVGHLCVFNSFGFINSFGIFQGYYTHALHRSPSEISWIGSLQILLIYGVGTLSGRLLDAGYLRQTLLAGLILQALGVFMSSLATQYWQLILAQGMCQGLGHGLLFTPAVANTATYFARKRTVAISSVACGGATGGMVFPAIAQSLLPRVGFPWTMRVMGFVMLFNALIILSLARSRIEPRASRSLVDWSAFQEMPYTLYCISMFLSFWGVWIAYYYVRILPAGPSSVVGHKHPPGLTPEAPFVSIEHLPGPLQPAASSILTPLDSDSIEFVCN